MKQPSLPMRVGSIVSAILLVGAVIASRAGMFSPRVRDDSVAVTTARAAARESESPTAPHKMIVMPGPKSPNRIINASEIVTDANVARARQSDTTKDSE